ncbi:MULTISPECIES: M20 family metallopeptidase [Brevibacillus]|jgi:succinyl-diaminopimelate desuccinylase|uniref:Acetylornithine deacetylase/succinyl-diaminopimelate desuccinylase n=1 Tax=Brevibacillus borstelensis AK1 TaxID=1300222 RepID=M8DW46_9BACL|nr:ArgE/DapE family deacylase [Brevibacillus borstelensis]EMT51221.1 acetylornithine deacetylase/succinyl-diaminopimelate desuccinylase [Brevibacillus borstelensis AK1]MCC0566602.1 ArgE/DapE family deacylase [Brevibacillus borstelensis]MCM3560658.1 ArgE/DapE family deacylase [Brevibacillus borstelensis]MCM3593114.1 ArgE/DapE family deacylase [Brevibacillus borstelensis]MED1853856.1 ArgE/DapE family deacylase [Brevibacillus borstelensis]
MTDWNRLVIEEIDKRQDELIELCSRLIQFPSENPPGDSRPISKFIIDYLKQEGIDTAIHESGETMWNLISTIGSPSPDRHLLYCGHTDVVPAGDLSRWDVPPYSGLVKDGFIHGRGATDMKGGLAGLIFVTGLFARLGVPLAGNLSLFIVPDEETGGDLGVPWVLDRGLIAGTAAVIAEPSHPQNPTIGQKGSCWFEFTVEGTPGHGSLAPLNGESAILKAARAIQALQKLWELKPDIPAEVQDIINISKEFALVRNPGKDVSAVHDHVTINIGTISGGTKVNVVADRCTVQVDTRVPFGLDYRDVLAEAKRLLLEEGIDVELKPFGFQGNANWTSDSEDIVRLLVESITDVSQKEAYGVLQWASSDARHFRKHGIPVLQYGPSELAGIHSFNERVPVDQVIQAAKVYALTALKYLGTTNANK